MEKSESIGSRNIVGLKIKELRDRLDMTQAGLTEELAQNGVLMKVSTLSKVENQHRGVTDIELAALSKVFEIDINSFFEK